MRLSVLRRFAPEPLRALAPMTEDLRGHPVIELILRRHDEGSRPGARTDGRRVALVIEGGGMRGVVSAGMTAAVEQLGLRDSFDEVHGASAGAFNGAFLLAGQAAYLAGLYQHGFGDPGFVSLRNVLRGGALFNMDYVVGEVWRHQRPLRTDEILGCGIDLHCTATDVDTTEIVDLADLRDAAEIRQALLASGRLPWLAGPPVDFRGGRFLDATLAEAIPVGRALRSATDILVLQTRPHGIHHSPLSGPVARLTDRYLTRYNPALIELRRTRSDRYDELNADLQRRAGDASASPALCVIRPPEHALLISQMENRINPMAIAGSQGLRAAWMAFTGEDPEVLATPRAHPRHRPTTAAGTTGHAHATGAHPAGPAPERDRTDSTVRQGV